jgi:bifunctional UDP-N-acetylglucosamine pyrophosphorylase/glucosamine-1-phosphate N-acetyltransferase
MTDNIGIVILAAGKGTRLKMDVPKPLAPIQNKTLIDFVINSVKEIGDLTLVLGHQENLVKEHIDKFWGDQDIKFAHQKEQLGTGHAVQTYFEKNDRASSYKYTIVACADTPLLTKEIFESLIEAIEGQKAVCAIFTEDNPTGYGRIIKADKGFSIVEEKDANDEQRKITEVNSGLYIFETAFLENHIKNLDSNNKAGEFYLTDTFKQGEDVKALHFMDKNYFLGVNDLLQLSIADRKLKARLMKELIYSGVRILDLAHTYIYSENVGVGSIIHPNVHIDESSSVGKNVVIEPGCIIRNSTIEDGAYIKAYTYITDSRIRKEATVGPMAQLRPGSDVGEKAKVGNFVEMKNASIGEKVGLSHLSYLGDAQVGKGTNIGCGFITCNYDGANKHKTIIGENSFIGSDCQMIAPIEIGSNAYVGSGSTINKDVPDGAFAIARERQVTKDDMAKKFIKTKKK